MVMMLAMSIGKVSLPASISIQGLCNNFTMKTLMINTISEKLDKYKIILEIRTSHKIVPDTADNDHGYHIICWKIYIGKPLQKKWQINETVKRIDFVNF